MLTKLPEIPIKSEFPFHGDALQRQDSIELLTKLVESTTQPFVLSVEAPWGFGKTRFIKMWQAHLELNKHVCLYFNAWENDFVDDPLVAFLGEMKKYVEDKFKDLAQDGPIKGNWEEVKRIAGVVLRKTLPLAIQIGTQGLLNQKAIKETIETLTDDADKIGEFALALAKERLEKYEKEKEGIVAFRNSLEKLASEITKQTDGKPPLIFFVDELDRCRPNFALALLERIKHLFNVPNVIFVLAVDRAQLNQCVKALYGMETKPDGYLRRFIDLTYQLPVPKGENFAWNLYNRFSFDEHRFQSQQANDFLKSFSDFAHVFGLSLRAQEQCFTSMNIALRMNFMIRNFPIVLSFLITLRAFKSDIIEELRSGTVEIEDVLKTISFITSEQIYNWAEAAMRVEFTNGKKAAQQLQEIRRLCAAGPIKSNELDATKRAQTINAYMSELNAWTPNAVAHILSNLELSSRFK